MKGTGNPHVEATTFARACWTRPGSARLDLPARRRLIVAEKPDDPLEQPLSFGRSGLAF